MSEHQGDGQATQSRGITANRRDVLRTAGGLVAATALAGALFDVSPETAAAAKAVNRLVVTIDDGSQSQFDATSLSFGVANSASGSVGSGGGAGKANFSDIALMKLVDAVTPRLQEFVATGRHLPRVRLSILSGRDNTEVGSMTLSEVLVTSDQVSIAAGETLTLNEAVTFSFARITLTYAGVTFDWNVAENTGM